MAAGPSYDPSRIPYEVRLRYEVKNVVARHLRLTHFDDLWVELCHLKDQISKLESRIEIRRLFEFVRTETYGARHAGKEN